MKVNIHVTAKDIDSGIPFRVQHCPVARAIGRRLNGGRFAAYVWAAGAWLYRRTNIKGTVVLHGLSEILPLSASAVEFMHKFDKGKSVKPFNFDIDIPMKYLKERKR